MRLTRRALLKTSAAVGVASTTGLELGRRRLAAAGPSGPVPAQEERWIPSVCLQCPAGCGLEEICPEQALRVRQGINPAMLQSAAVLAEDTMLRCRVCGEKIPALLWATDPALKTSSGPTGSWISSRSVLFLR